MKQFKPLVFFLAVFNLVFTTVFSQSKIEFSSDNFKTTTKLRTDMSGEELEKLRFKIPIDATFLKYDKVIASVGYTYDDKTRSLRNAQLVLYPKSATFKDHFEGKSEIIVSLLKMKVRVEGIKYYLVRNAENLENKSFKDYEEFHYNLVIGGYFENGYEYVSKPSYNGGGVAKEIKYKFSKIISESDDFMIKVDQNEISRRENHEKMYDEFCQYYPFNATVFALKWDTTKCHAIYAAYKAINEYYLEKKDYSTISKIQNKLLGLAKKEKKVMYHKLKEKTEENPEKLVALIME